MKTSLIFPGGKGAHILHPTAEQLPGRIINTEVGVSVIYEHHITGIHIILLLLCNFSCPCIMYIERLGADSVWPLSISFEWYVSDGPPPNFKFDLLLKISTSIISFDWQVIGLLYFIYVFLVTRPFYRYFKS
jgi:hypothetical protein